jgi:hypothetical protein
MSRNYDVFVRTNYAAAPIRSFRIMSRVAGGFGGVVFGDSITDVPQLPKVTTVGWERDRAEPSIGRLIFRFEDGSTRFVRSVLLEDVYAARAITFGGVADVPQMKEGEGVGLLGIFDPVEYFDCGETALIHEGRQWKIVMHPALANTDLGWSTLMTDTLPIVRSQFLKLVQENCGPDDLKQAQGLLDAEPGDWKFTDVPLVVEAEGDELVVCREATPDDDYPEDLRRQAWIGVVGFGRGGQAPEFSDRFYRLVPALVRASHDYDRLNNFAKVFALLRWAKAKGAKFDEAPGQPPIVPTPDSVIITEEGIVPAPAFEPRAAYRDLDRKIRNRLDRLVTAAPGLQALEDRFHALPAPLEQRRRDYDEAWTRLRQVWAQAVGRDALLKRSLDGATPEVRDQYSRLKREAQVLEAAYSAAKPDSPEADQIADQLKERRVQLDRFVWSHFAAIRTLDADLRTAWARFLTMNRQWWEAAHGQLAQALPEFQKMQRSGKGLETREFLT